MTFVREIVVSAFVEEHIWTKHHVTPEEVEELSLSDPLVLRGRDRSLVLYGQTDSGRYLVVFLYPSGKGTFRLATAREMEGHERRRYQREKGQR